MKIELKHEISHRKKMKHLIKNRLKMVKKELVNLKTDNRNYSF